MRADYQEEIGEPGSGAGPAALDGEIGARWRMILDPIPIRIGDVPPEAAGDPHPSPAPHGPEAPASEGRVDTRPRGEHALVGRLGFTHGLGDIHFGPADRD